MVAFDAAHAAVHYPADRRFRIWLKPSLLLVIVDGVWSMFGSANFDNRSLEMNDELNVAVSAPALARRLLEDFERDLQASKRIDPATWPHRSILERGRDQFWRWFGEVF